MDGEVEDLVGRLSGVPAGADLADLIEGLLSVLLVPAHPDVATDDTDDTDGAADANEVLSIPDTDAVLAAVTSPAERMLAEAAGRLGMDWGQGAGADALACLGGQVLSELVGACHRLGAWAAWAEGVAAACLTRTAEMNRGTPPWGPGGRLEQFITEDERRFTASGEIAARLGTTRSSVDLLLDRGQALLQPEFAATEALHRAGLLDTSKTALIVRRLQDVNPDTAAAVQERVLARAPRRTCSQLGRDIDRALAALDPNGASSRRRRDVAGRRVTRPRPAGEGTHEMRLLLPSLDALLLDATLDAIAASARAAGDSRSLSQLRADAITGMTLRTLQGSQNLACRTANANDVSAFTTAVSGTGPALATVGPGAAGLLPDGVPLPGLLGALSSLVEPSRPWWTPSGITPVFPPPGISVNVDVTVPLNQLLPEDGSEGLPACDGRGLPTSSGGRTVPTGSRATTPETASGSGSSLPETGGGSLPETGGGSLAVASVRGSSLPTDVEVTRAAGIGSGGAATVPRAVEAAEKAGAAEVVVGTGRVAVPAATARALAAGGTWRRLVTDPLSGVVLDVGRSHYRPPAGLRDLVQARDQECVFPGCGTPAARCDTDHITPWASGGATSLNNLTTLCQAHHRLKHTPGWTLTRQNTADGDGVLIWTTPTGARYRRTPDGTITLLPRRVGPRQLAMPAQQAPQHLADAVDSAVVSRLEHGLSLAAQAQEQARVQEGGPAVGSGDTVQEVDSAAGSGGTVQEVDSAAGSGGTAQEAAPAVGSGAAIAEAPGGASTRPSRRPGRPPQPPQVVSRGPRPGHPIGAFETAPFPQALHDLGLAPLLDQIPPF
ncbi:HNH endonuclease [Actinomyces sp. Z5]|uniref:HNH endonuclease signature motif containing protein n=1 Tax=Actinomyces sp. Z5 TaxID=2250216 RepID=UPI000DCBF72B|nr:HNH endonuclease signature motif containing protein [Actinomyces sp. Z5]RAX19168.1 HNH endonuclease [Actinomyces sp. Z5]